MSIFNKEITLKNTISTSLAMKVRANLAGSYLSAAEHFAVEAANLESFLKTQDDPWAKSDTHRYNSISAITLAATFIECAINEFFADFIEGPSEGWSRIDSEQKRILGSVWDDIDRTQSIRKFEIALTICNIPSIASDSKSENAALLLRLRNTMLHHKPEFRDHPATLNNLEQKLQGRFATNPFVGPNNQFFPTQCIAAGCARWAVQSAWDYVSLFFEQLGRPTIYSKPFVKSS